MPLVVPIALFGATIAFALGVSLPLIRVDRFFVLSEEASLVAVVAGLWRSGDHVLAGVIGLFSIAFPAIKLALLHVAAHGGERAAARLPAWLGTLSGWSMLDVVLVALVVFAAKTSGLASAATRPGLWFFALSVVLTALVAALLRRQGAPR